MTWDLAIYCTQVMRPAGQAYATQRSLPDAVRSAYDVAVDSLWAGERPQVSTVFFEEWVPNEDQTVFTTLDGLAQNALIALLHSIDAADGKPDAQQWAAVQLQEFADLIDQLQSDVQYVDATNGIMTATELATQALGRAAALAGRGADSTEARAAAHLVRHGLCQPGGDGSYAGHEGGENRTLAPDEVVGLIRASRENCSCRVGDTDGAEPGGGVWFQGHRSRNA
jgi:hypothetical protein